METTLSVVMAVRNDAKHLADTLASIVSLAPSDTEFCIVDDASTDATADILRRFAAQDKRFKLSRQPGYGLTVALIEGCRQATGRFIARHDGGGDISVGDRFTRQMATLAGDGRTVLVSGGTRFVGPAREQLYDVIQDSAVLRKHLDHPTMPRGPSHHGCTMFRRDAYLASGGYRREFRVAQDLDLWTRLSERGSCVAIPDILYQAQLNRANLSILFRRQQIRLSGLIARCTALRRAGRSERDLLNEIDKLSREIQPPAAKWRTRLADAQFHYFVGSCLDRSQPPVARRYFRQAVRMFPLHAKAMYKLSRLALRA